MRPIIFPYPNPGIATIPNIPTIHPAIPTIPSPTIPPGLLPHHVPAEPHLLFRPHPQQNLGGGANQPNVITQSVTWSASKKGVTAKPTTTIETDAPPYDYVLDAPDKTMRIVRPSRQRCRAYCPECELDGKLRRLVEILDNLQAREGDSRTYSRRTRASRQTRWPGWRCRYDPESEEEDEDVPVRQMIPHKDDYGYSEEEVPMPRRRPRRRMQRVCECEDPEDEEPLPRKRSQMNPKMDWLVLKKVPKKGPKRWMRDEENQRAYPDENATRDVLYIPPCDNKDKYRRRNDPEYDR